jgi:hypothetical protein
VVDCYAGIDIYWLRLKVKAALASVTHSDEVTSHTGSQNSAKGCGTKCKRIGRMLSMFIVCFSEGQL